MNEFKGKVNKSSIGHLKNNNGDLITNDRDKATLLNQHFATIAEKLYKDRSFTELGSNHVEHIYRVTLSISTIKVSFNDYENTFNKCVKSGKACGPDNINSKFLKQIGSLHSGFYEVVKKSVEVKEFPNNWQTGKVSCQFKKGNTTDCNNYRPITLLSIPSKVLEGVICDKIDDHLNSCNLISEHQWGFRAGRSIESLLIRTTDKLCKAMDEGKVVVALFIDFKKAFDCVPHSVLNKKLLASGILGDLHKFTMTYLNGRKQFTVVNGATSDIDNVKLSISDVLK